jgi:predicted transcriptional regulator of viral defense system
MNAREAYARLVKLGVPVVDTADAAAALGQSAFAASKTLARLGESGLVVPVRHGTWWLGAEVDPHRLADFVTAPFPAYLSLHTALYLRGMVEQIPGVLYLVSLARAQRLATQVGTYSIHHISPALFGGFDEMRGGAHVATPEKAIFDLAYLSGGRSRLFASVPELELPPRFRWRQLRAWVSRVPSTRARTLTTRRLERFLKRPLA